MNISRYTVVFLDMVYLCLYDNISVRNMLPTHVTNCLSSFV
jgi:hypothetical protein